MNPEEYKYTREHEWIYVEPDGTGVMGITDYAQSQLGDIVYVDLPDTGTAAGQSERIGEIESVKAVSELYMPVGGTILAINSVLEESPELVNNEPYGQGWMIELKPSDPAETEALMTQQGYLEMLKGL